jgi:hypothetical protein
LEFKDYKEKQKYYRDKAKEVKVFWVSTGTINKGTKEKPRFNGKTYIKPKGGESNVDR